MRIESYVNLCWKLTRCRFLDICGGEHANPRLWVVSDFQATVYVDAVKGAPFEQLG